MRHRPAVERRRSALPYAWSSDHGGVSRRRGLITPRLALTTGFVVVFALWLVWAYQLARSLRHIEETVTRAQAEQIRGEQTLVRIRTNVLLGSIYLRDAIIDAGPSHRENYQRDLLRLQDDVDVALRTYVPEVVSPAEREQWARLRTELREFWASRAIKFTDTREPADGVAWLQQHAVPQRDVVLEVLDQLAAVQSASNLRRQSDANALYRQIEARLMSMGTMTLGVAVFVAVMASMHVSRLQSEIERQRAAEQQNRENLERLSARLVHAQEQERRHLARELHDEVGQALTAVKMDIGIALRSDNPGRVRDALEEASHLTEITLRGVRDLSQLLHPSMLDDFGLPITLATYLRSFAQRTGIRAQLTGTIDERLVPEIEVGVYRIVQEALNNVAQHSGAKSCTVALSSVHDTLGLTIEDNGCSLDHAEARARQGLGLIGMRERAQGLGGTFVAGVRAGGGTRIAVVLPLMRARRDEATDLQAHSGSV
jgi:signal transduction histidine kinase